MAEFRTYDETTIGGVLDFDLLTTELTLALAGAGSPTICEGVSLDDDEPVGSRLRARYNDFLGAPEIAATDPVIAAHPSIGPDASGSLLVTSGNDYEIGRRVIKVGDVRVFDIHVAGYLGDQSDMQPIWIDAYPQAYRRTTGDVQIDRPFLKEVGSIPGFDLEITATATEAVFAIVMRKSGTFTVKNVSIDIKESYEVAP
jgi:hypothetical protein